MTRPSPANRRAFVRRNTHLQPVPDLPGVLLHLADDVAVASRLAAAELEKADPGLPFWAFAWAGGLAIACYLLDHPEEVAGLGVLDVASGSGLCAIVAARAGASSVRAVDIDPLSEAAVALNARVNRVRVGFTGHDPVSAPPPSYDVILAGDVSGPRRTPLKRASSASVPATCIRRRRLFRCISGPPVARRYRRSTTLRVARIPPQHALQLVARQPPAENVAATPAPRPRRTPGARAG